MPKPIVIYKLRQQGTLLIYSVTFMKGRAVFSEINLKKNHIGWIRMPSLLSSISSIANCNGGLLTNHFIFFIWFLNQVYHFRTSLTVLIILFNWIVASALKFCSRAPVSCFSFISRFSLISSFILFWNEKCTGEAGYNTWQKIAVRSYTQPFGD